MRSRAEPVSAAALQAEAPDVFREGSDGVWGSLEVDEALGIRASAAMMCVRIFATLFHL